jgi:hypothetical protein
MKPETIENILATEEPLVPSSGFLSSVMERVNDEAAAPAPIPFPWKRFVPVIVLAAGIAGWCAVEFERGGVSKATTISFTLSPLPAAAMQSLEQAGWVALALTASLFSWLLARRLAGRAGLL